ncbi:tweety 2-like protein [Venturia nashicola]|nr:tweety 2-like protein [Venturia nashicola]
MLSTRQHTTKHSAEKGGRGRGGDGEKIEFIASGLHFVVVGGVVGVVSWVTVEAFCGATAKEWWRRRVSEQHEKDRVAQDARGWRMEDGGWRMEDGGWMQEDGGWMQEDGGWMQEDGGWMQEDGGWRMVDGLALALALALQLMALALAPRLMALAMALALALRPFVTFAANLDDGQTEPGAVGERAQASTRPTSATIKRAYAWQRDIHSIPDRPCAFDSPTAGFNRISQYWRPWIDLAAMD